MFKDGDAVGVSSSVDVGFLCAATPARQNVDEDAAEREERDDNEAERDKPVWVARWGCPHEEKRVP